MGWLAQLFGGKPDRRKDLVSGFYWGGPAVTALAAGRGWNQAVVGESFYRRDLERIAGGATTYGVNLDRAAELRIGDYRGSATVEVWIDGRRCGSMPEGEAPALISELTALASSKPIVAKAHISAGYEGADYCVQLSLSRPLKERQQDPAKRKPVGEPA